MKIKRPNRKNLVHSMVNYLILVHVVIILHMFQFIIKDNINLKVIRFTYVSNYDRHNITITSEYWIVNSNITVLHDYKWILENWKNFTSSYIKMMNVTSKDVVPYPTTRIFKSYCKLYYLENAYASDSCLAINNTSYSINYRKISLPFNLTVVDEFKVAIFVRTAYGTYGHFIHDVLGAIILYPKEIKEQQLTIITNYRDFNNFIRHLQALEIYNMNICYISDKAVFVKKLYFLRPHETMHEFNGLCLPMLSDMFRKKFNLERIIPTKYKIINRRSNERRYFTNIPALKKQLKRKFPKIKFQDLELASTLKETGMRFAETKILIGSCGSLLCNTIFMRNETGLVVLFGNLIDLPNLAMLGFLHIYSVSIVHPKMSHHQGSGDVNIEETVKAVGIIIYTVEHKEYPYMKGYTPMINVTTFFTYKMRGNYNYDIWNHLEPTIP